MLVNSGRDLQALTMGGDTTALAGTATATTATSLTSTGFTASAYIGKIVVAGNSAATFVYGVIVSNTTTVLTVDRWYNPASPGGTAASTPSATAPFLICPYGAGAPFTALTANNSAAAGGDTALTGEITTAGGGLVRKLSAYAHTSGVASYTLTTVYTANGSDSLPVTVAKMGAFNSVVGATGTMAFETLLSATATLSASGDQLTTTDTVTQS
jgi:hypothetical protein